jgi:hypothetical protein
MEWQNGFMIKTGVRFVLGLFQQRRGIHIARVSAEKQAARGER